MKIAITIENHCQNSIPAGSIQIRAKGMPDIGPDDIFGDAYASSTGFRRGLGFCYLYTSQESLDVGQKISIEVETFTEKETFLLAEKCDNEVHIQYISNGDAVVLTET